MAKLAVTLVKSPIGNRPEARSTVLAIGLRRLHQTVIVPDNESVRGMVTAIQHLVKVEAASDHPAPKTDKKPVITVIPAPKQESTEIEKREDKTKIEAEPARRRAAKRTAGTKEKASVAPTVEPSSATPAAATQEEATEVEASTVGAPAVAATTAETAEVSESKAGHPHRAAKPKSDVAVTTTEEATIEAAEPQAHPAKRTRRKPAAKVADEASTEAGETRSEVEATVDETPGADE